MSFRRLYYTRPAYLERYIPKKPEYIVDFGQLERRSDYYRTRPSVRRYTFPTIVVLLFLALFSVTGYYSLTPGTDFSALQLPTKNNIPLVSPSTAAKKVVESVSLSADGKIYSYTVQNGDSYARLVKRAVMDFSRDQKMLLSTNEVNSVTHAIITQTDQIPLHPGNVYTISAKTIHTTILTLYP
jgi:hypothetical protein